MGLIKNNNKIVSKEKDLIEINLIMSKEGHNCGSIAFLDLEDFRCCDIVRTDGEF